MTQIKTINNRFFSLLPYLVFAIASFIYFGFFGDYVLFYQEKSSLFIFSSEFLLENLHQPGGFLIYLGKFFSTFFYYPVMGALIISGISTLAVWIISKIIFSITGTKASFLPFFLGIAFFFIQTDYRYLFYNNLGLFLQLGLYFLVIRYLTYWRGWIPFLIIPLWFFLTGGFSFVFSIMLTSHYAFGKEKGNWSKILILWFLNLTIFYISQNFLFFQPGKVLLVFPFAERNAGSQSVLFLTIAAILAILPAIARIRLSFPARLKVSDLLTWLISISLLVISLVFISIMQFDKKTKEYFHVEKLFYQNKYDEVIAYNSANPSTNSLTIFLNNIALCETDKLNDLLFHYLQSPEGNTLFLKWEMFGEVLKRGGSFYYTIGMINEAHRWAFENMVMKGQSPEGLKMLIKTDLINGNYEVASSYNSILKKTLFYKNEAKRFEKLLFNDTALNADREIGEKRRNRLVSDFFSITDEPYYNIERILSSDSLNKNAFEYKLAFMLLAKNYEGISRELPRLESFGFTKIPTHIEEAALALSLMNLSSLPEFGNLQITANTKLRWNRYLTVFQQYGNDLKRAEPSLRREFGDTFWYYAFYR